MSQLLLLFDRENNYRVIAKRILVDDGRRDPFQDQRSLAISGPNPVVMPVSSPAVRAFREACAALGRRVTGSPCLSDGVSNSDADELFIDFIRLVRDSVSLLSLSVFYSFF